MAETLRDMVLSSAAIHAAHPALWVDGKVTTYYELIHDARLLAARLIGQPQRRTAIYADRRYWSYVAVLGCLLAGHAYVPLNPHHPKERQRAVLQSADVGALVLDAQSLTEAGSLVEDVPIILLPDDLAEHEQPDPAISPADGAYLLFTSGSTGEPKGILVSHANIVAYLHSALHRYHLTPQDRTTQLFDLTFDLSVHDMFVTWVSGATLYCPNGPMRKTPGQFVNQHALTCWFSTPSTIAYMARLRMLRPNLLPSLRLSLFCGEALPRRLVEQWQQVAPNSVLENLYGPTEATIAITAFRIPNDLTTMPDVIPIGEPFPGQEARLASGELMLGGSQVTNGYWRQSSTKFTTREGQRWFATGDLVVKSQHGLEFRGRLDRQVKVLGNRVELAEIEARLSDAASTVAAVAWPIRDGIAHGIVVFVTDDARPIDEIMIDCRSRLPPYMVPSRVVWLSEWPLNSNGKTDYRGLVKILETRGAEPGPSRKSSEHSDQCAGAAVSRGAVSSGHT